ncbi:hypothetical protein PAMP_006143 [Pampus punctatissimus]
MRSLLQPGELKVSRELLREKTANPNPLPVPVGVPASSVLVESGPVVYDDVAGDEDEEEEEEETCVSAMELMGGHVGR